MRRYRPRVADRILQFKLRSAGAVEIKGPKWCGKTTTAEQVAASSAHLLGSRESAQLEELAKNAPDLFLAGDVPRLVDEWQTVPFIWDDIRSEVDRRGEVGQFVLTGSATPIDGDADPRRHSGIGRIAPMTMRTMTLSEFGDGPGGVSVAGLFEGADLQSARCDLSLEDYAFLTCRGGWPSALDMNRETALEQARIFFEGLVADDIGRVCKNTRNPERVKRVLRALARATSSETSIASLRKDMLANDSQTLSEETVASYVNTLERLYVVENLEGWNPNLRSKTAVRTSVTRHFTDPSIACAALGIGPGDLIGDLRTFGLFFESLAVRDLRTYAEALGGGVSHYRDASGLEADAVLHAPDGSWAAIEVKLGSTEGIEVGAASLRKLAGRVDEREERPASFLMVVTASQYAYRREDGVLVVPLGCLEA